MCVLHHLWSEYNESPPEEIIGQLHPKCPLDTLLKDVGRYLRSYNLYCTPKNISLFNLGMTTVPPSGFSTVSVIPLRWQGAWELQILTVYSYDRDVHYGVVSSARHSLQR